jgi:RNAse (barnase) inhibitor barstar
MSHAIPLVEILGHSERNGLYRLRGAAKVEQGRHMDGRRLNNKHTMLAALAEALSFPDYFGFNWDAADECLTDLSWHDGDVVLVIDDAGTPESSAPEDWGVLIELLTDAARFWQDQGRSFVVLLRGGHAAYPMVAQ